MTIVQEIYDKNTDISDIELAEEIIKHPNLEVLDLWLLPQYAFDKWRRKYDYPGILKNIKDNVPDFVNWMNDQAITDEHLLSGYFSDFFEHKTYSSDKRKALVRTTYKGKEWLQVWYKYDGEKEGEGDGEPVRYEYIKHFIPYYDWVEQREGRFCFTDTFFRSNPNTPHENVFLNHNFKLLKMGGIHPPLNGFGAMLRGKKLEFINVSGLKLHGTIYFSNFGNLSFYHCAVDNMKCDELDMPNLDFYYSSIKNFQVRNSEINHWMFLYSKTSGNIIDSKLTHSRIYGGQFTPTFTNTQIDTLDVRHKDLFCEPDFEKTYRGLAKCAKDSGDKHLSQKLKIAEYDFIREKKTGVAKALMTADKIYWEYGQNPKRLVAVAIAAVFLFGLLFSFFPNNFKGHDLTSQPYYKVLFNSEYYSVVTFTTLGYGDLSPMGFLKFFAALEALFGAITLGFLVSGLTKND